MTDSIDFDLDAISEAEWDAILRDIAAARQEKVARRNNPYVLDLIRVLRRRETGMSRGMTIDLVRNNRKRLGLPIPRTFEQTVQQSMERFCIDSDVFKKRDSPDSEAIFSWPEGKGRGRWASRQPHTDNWLRKFVEKRQKQIGNTGI